MGRVGEHLEGFDGVGLERAVEDEETGEDESGLDLVSSEFVDLNQSGRRRGDHLVYCRATSSVEISR